MTATLEPTQPRLVKIGDLLILTPHDYRRPSGVLRLEITSINWPQIMEHQGESWVWVEGYPIDGGDGQLWWRTRQLVRVSALLRPQGGGLS